MGGQRQHGRAEAMGGLRQWEGRGNGRAEAMAAWEGRGSMGGQRQHGRAEAMAAWEG